MPERDARSGIFLFGYIFAIDGSVILYCPEMHSIYVNRNAFGAKPMTAA
jgi:hypothetical protein